MQAEWEAQKKKERRNQLVMENTGLVYMVLKRFQNRGCDMEDLFQIGMVGLIKAIDHFDEGKGYLLSTYAVPLITGEILRFLRDDGVIRIGRSVRSNSVQIAKVREQWVREKGVEPTIEELMQETGIGKENLILALQAPYEVASVNATYGQEESGQERETCVQNGVGKGEKSEEEQWVNRLMVEGLLEQLEDKERQLVELRFFQEKSQSEIARSWGTNQVAVSRMEKKVLWKLRHMLQMG